jgi:transcriptional regulator with XRE-family HTH domain
MSRHIRKPIKPLRLGGLPNDVRLNLKESRRKRGWSQTELGKRAGLPQMHVSGIESGKIVPRFDTLLDLARVLDYDLVMVPRALVPAVQALIRSQGNAGKGGDQGERSLYAGDEESEPEERRRDEV